MGLKETRTAYEQLCEALDPGEISQWQIDEASAMRNRGEELKIFEVQEMKLPTLADIRLELTEKEGRNRLASGTISWLADGVALEQAQ